MTEVRASDYFAIVPEWLLHAEISGNAVRLFAILHRYANSRLEAWPSRKTIAAAMRCSTATVDRAREELVEVGALTVIQRTTDAGDPTSNLYILHMRPVDNGEKSSPVTKGIPTDEETGLLTGDDLNRDRVIHSHLGTSSPVSTGSTWCQTCHGRRVVIGQAKKGDDGYVYNRPPEPCPECVL